jgi:diguanylate cyclase (GGDEF)-like protein/PAS domain S-box-containing protein
MTRPSPRATPNHEALIEQALVGVYVIQHDRLVYANPRLADMFGYTVEELLALPTVLMLVDESERGEVAGRIERRISGEMPTSTHSMRGRRKDGSLVELEVYGTTSTHEGAPAVTGTMVDVTERRRWERDLEAREQRYRHLIEHASDAVFTYDLSGCITSLNRAGEQLTGYSAAEAQHMTVGDFVLPSQRALLGELIQRLIRDRRDTTQELEVVTKSGLQRTLEVSSRLIERDGVPAEVLGIARDITARKQEEHALRSLTIIDELTQLYNRRGFLTLAERHLKLAARRKVGVFLLFADLDGLKTINDTYGHLAGDRALVSAADVLRRTFRSADIIARLGGDEFTVFPLEAASESGSLLIHRLEEAVQADNDANAARGFRLALSVGIARFEPDTSWTIDQLLDQADRALYAQKRLRRDRTP